MHQRRTPQLRCTVPTRTARRQQGRTSTGTAAQLDDGGVLHTDLLGKLIVPGSLGRGAELQDLAVRAADYASRARGAWSRPRAGRAGLDQERYSGHSLRAGLATAAGDAGASLPDLMRQTRHKSTEVALGYLRPADLWRNNVTEGVFGTKAGRSE